MNINWGTAQYEDADLDTVLVEFDNESERAQAQVLLEALSIYATKNEQYKDNWRRMGRRGLLVRLRERAERLWDSLWAVEGKPAPAQVDDAIDLINFAAFLVRAARGEATRDGSWWEGM
jgi:hypothetical protein